MKKLFAIFLLTMIMTPVLISTATATKPVAPEPATIVDTPIIPKPDFLPGPSAEMTAKGADTQDFILNTGVPRAINIVIGLLGIATFIAIVIASISMLTAFGNEDKYTKAKTNLFYAIMGFVIVLLSFALVSIIVSVALPSESGSSFIPHVYAVDVNKDINLLLPEEKDFIQDQGNNQVSLPSGDFLTEIVPAVIINVFYVIGFLIVIAFTAAGIILVTGRGNEESVTKAKQIASFSGIAIALLALGFALVYGLANLNLSQDTQQEINDQSFQLFDSKVQ